MITDKNGNIIQNGKIIGNINQGNVVSLQPKSLEQRLNINQQKSQGIKENKVQKTSFKKEYTKYQVREDSYFTIQFGLIQNQQNRIIVLSKKQAQQLNKAQLHWVKFRMWTYKEQIKWKDDCMKMNSQYRNFMIDINKLNQMKLRNLINDWSFACYNDKFKLLHVGGYLSDESYQIFKGFYPNIINYIINSMNEVLQNNG